MSSSVAYISLPSSLAYVRVLATSCIWHTQLLGIAGEFPYLLVIDCPFSQSTYGPCTYQIFSALRNVVGLRSLWRFPDKASENSGAAFIIPYLAASSSLAS